MTEQLNMQALRMLEVYEIAPRTALNVIQFPHTRLFLVNKSKHTHTHTQNSFLFISIIFPLNLPSQNEILAL